MSSRNPRIRALSAQNAALIRHGSDNTQTAADLAAEQLAQYVARVVAAAPPLSPAQRDRVAALLRAGGRA